MKFSKEEPVDDTPIKPWKELLEPFAELHWRMDNALHNSTDEHLATLLDACSKPTSTNCWFATYNAAKWIKPEIEAEQARRKLERERQARSAI